LEVVRVVDRPSRPVGVCWCWVTGWVIHQCCQCPIQWFVECQTKSAWLVGGAPVRLSTSLFGREPWPGAMVSVSNRSMSVWSAGTPAAMLDWTQVSRSMS
jgi:hypothetical protein